MVYKELGRTGMRLSNVGFGASSLGGVFHSIREAEAIEAVGVALDCGVNFIDVSPYYGHYKAETVLGKALRQLDRSRYYLSTKVGRYGQDGVNTWDYSAERTLRSVQESMERMGVDHIDLINVHDIEFADLEQVCNETLPALVSLREQGVVGHVGITNLTLRHLRYVIDHVPEGTVESVLSFCHYTLNDDALVDYLDYFESHGVGVINASPYSMGLLTQRGVPDWHPAPAALQRLARKAVAYCQEHGVEIEHVAAYYSMNNPRIASTLFSTSNPANVLKTVKYAETPVDPAITEAVRHILEPGYRDTWVNS